MKSLQQKQQEIIADNKTMIETLQLELENLKQEQKFAPPSEQSWISELILWTKQTILGCEEDIKRSFEIAIASMHYPQQLKEIEGDRAILANENEVENIWKIRDSGLGMYTQETSNGILWAKANRVTGSCNTYFLVKSS